MQVLRLATLALLAACAASGCRTAGVNDLARPNPPLSVPSPSANAAAILAEHNRNAERIQTIDARSDLTVTAYEHERPNWPSSHALNGNLAMERPRNFKLVLNHPAATAPVGDIGSNDTEYWFWVKDRGREQNAIYYCNYDEAGASPLAATFQPDWIKEAMGLRVIPEAEAAEITVKPGEPGTLVLTHRPHKSGSETYTRVTIIDKATHQILEHQIRSADQKTILAQAKVPEGYMRVADLSAPAENGEGGATVLFPKRLQLHWTQDRLTLDVTFKSNVKINAPFTQARRDLLFVEPLLGRGYTRINLAEGPAKTTTIHETRPAPPTGVRLRAPAPIEGEEATRRDDRSTPIALGGAEPMIPPLTEEIIGQRIPTPVEPEAQKAQNPGWRAATNFGSDR